MADARSGSASNAALTSIVRRIDEKNDQQWPLLLSRWLMTKRRRLPYPGYPGPDLGRDLFNLQGLCIVYYPVNI